MNTVYDFSVEKMSGETTTLENYSNQVMLIVNTASKCGFTNQFEGLQKLYETYQDQGFVILGFPSDQFMNQEFEDQDEILNFCQTNYGVSFPMHTKTNVKGKEQHPLFHYLTEEKKGMFGGEIKWNFTKFLVNREGKVVERYSPQTKPEKIEADIKKYL